MEKHEELLTYFKRKASELLFKYSIANTAHEYGYQYLRMSSYFGKLNENLIELEKELKSETENILSNYLKDDMDTNTIKNFLTVYRNDVKLKYLVSNNP